MEPLPRQLIPVRPCHLETPTSYLRRLCGANSIDGDWMFRHLRKRRLACGRDERDLGVAIAELGGPDPSMFEQAYNCAKVGHENLRGPWGKQAATRTACLSCTAMQRVTTYPHIRFAFCRRHGRWLGTSQHPAQRPEVMDAAIWKAERRLRVLVRTGHVNRDLYETAWELVRDNAYLSTGKTWSPRLRAAWDSPGFVREVDDRIALFAETVRVLGVTAEHEFAEKIRTGHYDSTVRRTHLYRALEWAGPQRWVLVEGIDQFFNRDSE